MWVHIKFKVITLRNACCLLRSYVFLKYVLSSVFPSTFSSMSVEVTFLCFALINCCSKSSPASLHFRAVRCESQIHRLVSLWADGSRTVDASSVRRGPEAGSTFKGNWLQPLLINGSPTPQKCFLWTLNCLNVSWTSEISSEITSVIY